MEIIRQKKRMSAIVACRKSFEWMGGGVGLASEIYRLAIKRPRINDNDNRLPTSDDRKASFTDKLYKYLECYITFEAIIDL